MSAFLVGCGLPILNASFCLGCQLLSNYSVITVITVFWTSNVGYCRKSNHENWREEPKGNAKVITLSCMFVALSCMFVANGLSTIRYAKVARHTKKPHRTKKNFIRPTMALHHPTSPLPSSPTTAPHPLSATSIMALTLSEGRSSSSSSSLMRSNKSRRRHRLVLQRRQWRTGP